jgi:citrate synthase
LDIAMSDQAKIEYAGKSYELPVVVGTESEVGVNIGTLRGQSGMITLDDGYANTGSCQSAITFIDGEKGILRYRGYPIEELAEKSSFVEVSYLIIFGELPTADQLAEFRALLTENQFIHEDMRHHFEGFPTHAHPMAILSAMINAMGCYQPALLEPSDDEYFTDAVARLMSKVRTIAAASYKKSIGQPMIYPRADLSYAANFLHMMFSQPNSVYEPDEDVARALNQILILHADHEQNCSTSTVRMVGSSQANMYASVAAGVCALWGPLHGGANQACIQMLSEIHKSGESVKSFIDKVKDKQSKVRLMGFGHRVYKNFDPRATIIKKSCDLVLSKMGIHDPLLDIAKELEEAALHDEYFIKRKLYPNVDFYSGIIYRAIGIPVNMFTPRQIYIGEEQRPFVPLEDRK